MQIPQIGSRIPLAVGGVVVLHWLRVLEKLSLEADGELADGYTPFPNTTGASFDNIGAEKFKVDPAAARKFVAENKPSDVEWGKWLAENGQFTPETAEEWNGIVNTYDHGEEKVEKMLTPYGLGGFKANTADYANSIEDAYDYLRGKRPVAAAA